MRLRVARKLWRAMLDDDGHAPQMFRWRRAGGHGIGGADIMTFDERVIDVGQPKCDGSCGAIASYRGGPCLLDRARCSESDRRELRDAIADGDTP